jgi:hypothetical protein
MLGYLSIIVISLFLILTGASNITTQKAYFHLGFRRRFLSRLLDADRGFEDIEGEPAVVFGWVKVGFGIFLLIIPVLQFILFLLS